MSSSFRSCRGRNTAYSYIQVHSWFWRASALRHDADTWAYLIVKSFEWVLHRHTRELFYVERESITQKQGKQICLNALRVYLLNLCYWPCTILTFVNYYCISASQTLSHILTRFRFTFSFDRLYLHIIKVCTQIQSLLGTLVRWQIFAQNGVLVVSLALNVLITYRHSLKIHCFTFLITVSKNKHCIKHK